MKKYRSVSAALYAEPYDMGGFPIEQPFPTSRIEQIDPFILLHHADVKVPTHIPPKKAGVGPHPHKGFSPVTFIFKGAVHHRDSRDNNSIIHEGGVQWMNAGRGIIHSERPPENIMELGGRQEIIQMWVNTLLRIKWMSILINPLRLLISPPIKARMARQRCTSLQDHC
jgi:redox-sensitive bicupin YhaK (pirin superfamily)